LTRDLFVEKESPQTGGDVHQPQQGKCRWDSTAVLEIIKTPAGAGFNFAQ
jgi:hypothetical protein